jgi:hypothetical protein
MFGALFKNSSFANFDWQIGRFKLTKHHVIYTDKPIPHLPPPLQRAKSCHPLKTTGITQETHLEGSLQKMSLLKAFCLMMPMSAITWTPSWTTHHLQLRVIMLVTQIIQITNLPDLKRSGNPFPSHLPGMKSGL